MAKKKIDLTKQDTNIQCFCMNDTPKNRGAVIGATDKQNCTCILKDGQGLADDVRVDRVIVSELGIRTADDITKPPLISSRTLAGVKAQDVSSKDPKFINLSRFKTK